MSIRALSLTLLGLLACNAAPTDGVDAEVSSSTYALISVQRSGLSSQSPRAELVARFVRSKGEAGSTFAALSSSFVMPKVGTCSKLSALLPPSEDANGMIELLDVGRVEVASNASARSALEPRELPNLGDFARGTFYAHSGTHVTPGARYDVVVGGSNDLGPLSVSAYAPHELTDVAFNGIVAEGSSINLPNGGALRLTWSRSDASDVLYVDTTGDQSHETTRCVFADTGAADVTLPAAGSGQIEVHRLRRHLVSAPVATEVRFDFYRSFAFRREE